MASLPRYYGGFPGDFHVSWADVSSDAARLRGLPWVSLLTVNIVSQLGGKSTPRGRPWSMGG